MSGDLREFARSPPPNGQNLSSLVRHALLLDLLQGGAPRKINTNEVNGSYVKKNGPIFPRAEKQMSGVSYYWVISPL